MLGIILLNFFGIDEYDQWEATFGSLENAFIVAHLYFCCVKVHVPVVKILR